MRRSSKGSEKGQKSLTSFFAANLKNKLVQEISADRQAEDKASSARKTAVDEDEVVIISQDEVEEAGSKTSPQFERPSKRPKLDHDLGYVSQEDDVQSNGAQRRLVGGQRIPDREQQTHEKFQAPYYLARQYSQNSGTSIQRHTLSGAQHCTLSVTLSGQSAE